LQILVAGVSGHSAHIYGVFDPGASKCFDSINFTAIGSGYPHAVNTLIARGFHNGFSVQDAIMAAYEAKARAENAPGVGATTDITVLLPDQKIDFQRESISDLGKVYERWNRSDQRWLNDLEQIIRRNGGSSDDGKATKARRALQSRNRRGKANLPNQGVGVSPSRRRRKEAGGPTNSE